MNDIAKAHKIILGRLNKTQYGHLSPEVIDDAIHVAQLNRYTNLFGDPADIARNPKTKISYGQIQKIDDELSPFMDFVDFTSNSTSGGVLNLPSTYKHYLGVITRSPVGVIRKTTITSENDLANILASQIVGPTVDRPAMMVSGKGVIQYFPESPQQGRVYFLKKPVAPKYAYTITDRVVTQDIQASVNLEWGDASMKVIIDDAINICSDHLRDVFMAQTSIEKINRDA